MTGSKSREIRTLRRRLGKLEQRGRNKRRQWLPKELHQSALSAKAPNGKGFVYVCRANDYYKIGHTTNLRRRQLELSAANPGAIMVLGILVANACATEKRLHAMFRDERRGRELFELDAAKLALIRDELEAAR
jgi:hypothetical protein